MTEEKRWLRVREVAQDLGVSTKTIYSDIKKGKLKASRLGGGLIRIDRLQLQHYLNGASSFSGGFEG